MTLKEAKKAWKMQVIAATVVATMVLLLVWANKPVLQYTEGTIISIEKQEISGAHYLILDEDTVSYMLPENMTEEITSELHPGEYVTVCYEDIPTHSIVVLKREAYSDTVTAFGYYAHDSYDKQIKGIVLGLAFCYVAALIFAWNRYKKKCRCIAAEK